MTDNHHLIIQFGRAVRRLREQHGWSQEQLAGRADINRSYLGEVERATVMPSLATAAKLAQALKVPLSAVIAGCEQPAFADHASATPSSSALAPATPQPATSAAGKTGAVRTDWWR